MSNLNAKTAKTTTKKVVNHEGEENFSLSPKEQFATLIATNMVSGKFYEGKEDSVAKLDEAIENLANVDPEFALKAAAYARKVLNMRSAPQIVVAECSRKPKFKQFVGKWAPHIMSRADEPTDALAYYLTKYGRPIPNSLKRAIKGRLESFGEYQLAKYRSGNSVVKLADVVKLVHPNLGDLGKKIIEGTLKNKETWESKLSASGGKNKAEAWGEAIPTMGYMALLRNLRNFVNEDIDAKSLDFALSVLSDRDRVKKSRQFPFRFYSAHRELAAMPVSAKRNRAMDAVAKAMEYSVDNVNIDGDTLIVVDSSGSMTWNPISKNSSLRPVDVGAVLGCIGVKKSAASELWLFDNNVKVLNPSRTLPILDMAKMVINSCNGGATLFYKVLELMIDKGKKYDNVIVISDYQVYADRGYLGKDSDTLWKSYVKSVNPDANLHVIDTVGYGRGNPIERKGNVFLYAGWSEKVLEMIGRNDGSSLVAEIEAWNPDIDN